jgi:uncharacterized membrane protein YciS (DUF1049 family)
LGEEFRISFFFLNYLVTGTYFWLSRLRTYLTFHLGFQTGLKFKWLHCNLIFIRQSRWAQRIYQEFIKYLRPK